MANASSTAWPAGLAAFVRPDADAYLGLVVISDQDDCSTSSNLGVPAGEIPTEAPGLRCATRGHACGGVDLPYPTTASYTAPLTDCVPRTDPVCSSSNDTNQATDCSPLADVHALAEQVKALKPGRADEAIAVVGIFGWPRPGPSGRPDLASAEYKIAPIPNPSAEAGTSAPATLFDLWPVCYDPDHPPLAPDPATGFDIVAAAYGAKPSLRLSAFIDEFGSNGTKYSVCEPDWKAAMAALGPDQTKKLLNSYCIGEKIVDADPSTPTLEPDCIVQYLVPGIAVPSQPTSTQCTGVACPAGDSPWTSTTLPRCDDPPIAPCWRLQQDRHRCPEGQYLNVYTNVPNYIPDGTFARVQCRLCPGGNTGTAAPAGCSY